MSSYAGFHLQIILKHSDRLLLLSYPGYRAAVLHSLPRLMVLDGLDRNGRPVVKDGDLDDIPGEWI